MPLANDSSSEGAHWSVLLAVVLAGAAVLYLLHVGPETLIAHDEALYATRAGLMLDTGDFIHPFQTPHHKPPGYYWLLAGMFELFGRSEMVARLPNGIIAVGVLLLVHAVAREVMSRQAALLSVTILATMPYFFHHARLAAPDMSFVALSLGGLYAALRAGREGAAAARWSFVAGCSIGLISLMRGPALIAPLLGVMPLVAARARTGRFSPQWMMIGLAAGLAPVAVWLCLAWLRVGNPIFAALIGFSTELALTERQDNGPEFYFWNMLVNGLPWSAMALAGLWGTWRRTAVNTTARLVLFAYPAIVLLALTAFSTRLPHYALGLYPFIALIVGATLARIIERPTGRDTRQAAILAAAAALLTAAAASWLIPGTTDFGVPVDSRMMAAVIIAVLCPLLPASAISIARPGQRIGGIPAWLAGIFLGLWCGLLVAPAMGVVGDSNAQMRRFLSEPGVAAIVGTQPVDIALVEPRAGALLHFMLPYPGRIDVPWEELTGRRASFAFVPIEATEDPRADVVAISDRYEVALVRWR